MTIKSQNGNRDRRVALVHCENYDPAVVSAAVARGLSLLGGVESFFKLNETLLLKPNLLLGDSPERGSTTHPAIFRAVIEQFQRAGAHLVYGDSPGFGSPTGAVRVSGLLEVADAFGVPLADFTTGEDVPFSEGQLMKQFHLAAGVRSADGLINLPKFKTHGLMRLTGAVKNLFGCLPGVQKAGFHARLPDEYRFGEMLVDLAELISPRLHIMDGVVAMEGNGPRNGQHRTMAVLLFSTNPYVLDHVMAQMAALDPQLLQTLRIAQKRGLYTPEQIQVLGDPLSMFIQPNFVVNRDRTSTTGKPGFWMTYFKNWVTPRPVIDSDQCSYCGRCVRVCPATPKALAFQNGCSQSPDYDYDACIRCYCCQEMCPENAISIQTPALGRLVAHIRG